MNSILKDIRHVMPAMLFVVSALVLSLAAVQSVRASGGDENLLEAHYKKSGGGAGIVLLVSLQRAH